MAISVHGTNEGEGICKQEACGAPCVCATCFMYWYMPGLCREYVSSFDDCIPLETLSYEQLNGVLFAGVNIL